MEIRKTKISELAGILPLFDDARRTMRADGNLTQWPEGYPKTETIAADIENGNSYVCVDDNGEIAGTFACIYGPEPTYSVIYGGSWLEEGLPYATIHRLAAKAGARGVSQACFEWCIERFPNLRIDTHRDNSIMRHIISKYGFVYRGIIHLADGAERLAYQRLDRERL